MSDVIAAIATPAGRGAIGVVRMSGDGAPDILKGVWKSARHPVDKFVTHRLYLGNIIDLSTGESLDRAMACIMRGPNSYTGEDVIEISCHGGETVLKSILGQLLAAGARVAHPGEFTKRAFLNGKIDLAQAEAVASLIDARSEEAVKIAKEQLDGRLSKTIAGMRDELKTILARTEASIDFPEEDEKFLKEGEVGEGLAVLMSKIATLLETYEKGRIIRDGVKVVIAGPPNAGKSSLLNSILGHERAIVHHVPGTTRDTIEEEALIDGVVFRFVDTAGIREAEEEVEEIGVERSKRELGLAEIVLLIIDGNSFAGVDPRFVEELRGVARVAVVVNKKDLGINISHAGLKEIFGERPVYEISAKDGSGVDDLLRHVVREVKGGFASEREGNTITSRRHLRALIDAKKSLEDARVCVEKNESAEFVAVHLRASLASLGDIVGEVATDEILNEIFGSFCIGK